MAGGLGRYLANQIHQGNLEKEAVFTAYPTLKKEINQCLAEWSTIPEIEEEIESDKK